MSEIKLRADEAQAMANHIQKEAATAVEQVNSLEQYLSGLSDSFTGRTATAFQGRFDDWHGAATQMLEGLDSLGEFLNKAVSAFDEADSNLAGQLSS